MYVLTLSCYPGSTHPASNGSPNEPAIHHSKHDPVDHAHDGEMIRDI